MAEIGQSPKSLPWWAWAGEQRPSPSAPRQPFPTDLGILPDGQRWAEGWGPGCVEVRGCPDSSGGGAHHLLICSPKGPGQGGGRPGPWRGSQDRGTVRRKEVTQRVSPTWVGTSGPGGGPEGLSRMRQASWVSRDKAAWAGWSLGAQGLGGQETAGKAATPAAQDPGHRVSQFRAAGRGAATPQPQGSPHHSPQITSASETCREPSSAPRPMSTGSPGICLSFPGSGGCGHEDVGLQAKEGWVTLTLGGATQQPGGRSPSGQGW